MIPVLPQGSAPDQSRSAPDQSQTRFANLVIIALFALLVYLVAGPRAATPVAPAVPAPAVPAPAPAKPLRPCGPGRPCPAQVPSPPDAVNLDYACPWCGRRVSLRPAAAFLSCGQACGGCGNRVMFYPASDATGKVKPATKPAR